MEFIAHRRDDGCEQSILEHLQGTAKLARLFGEAFGAGELAEQCGLYHDIGKYSQEFQAYIRGERSSRVDHSTAGALEMIKAGMLPLAFCIAGHHAGLPDAGSKVDTSEKPSLRGRCKRKDIFDFQAFRRDLPEPISRQIPREMAQDGFSAMLFTRMLFSCLTDADFLDTEQFMSGGSVRRGGFVSIGEAAVRFFEQLEARGFLAPENKINEKRADILRACLQAGKGRQGIYSLTVPTGGGKTVAATAFAMSQCRSNGLRRIIYVIPYTSIIEQTADVLRSFVNCAGDKVDNIVEHHSSVDYDDPDAEKGAALKKLATENWEAPIVVTTNVQFFESLFAGRTSKCRKLHNIAGSVLIFDEAQMLPSEYLRPVLLSLSLLVRHYGCTVLLCSATQPHLEQILQDYGTCCREVIQDIPSLYKFFRRTKLQMEGLAAAEEIAGRMAEEKQVLCIATTKPSAQAIYEALPAGEGIYLSTNLCPVHRRRVIADIRRRLKAGRECRVVSTTVISVGVDVDFPTGYVELSGLDSIIQAAGRVNREGKRPAADSVVHVFQTEKGRQGHFLTQERSVTELMQHEYDDLSAPEAIDRYFAELYHSRGDSLDKENIIAASEHFPFREIAHKVKLIKEDSISVLVPFDEQAETLIAELRQGQRSRSLLRRAGQYTVSVRRSAAGQQSDFSRLHGVGAVELLDEELAVLTNMDYYDRIQGLLIPELGGAVIM